MQMEKATFYQPLNKQRKEIRIAHVQAALGNLGPIRCRLETVSLLSKPKPSYVTLSYCWVSHSIRRHGWDGHYLHQHRV